jgi:hypothetical protein
MKKIFAAAAMTLAFAPSGVLAQERAGDAALGALSGQWFWDLSAPWPVPWSATRQVPLLLTHGD